MKTYLLTIIKDNVIPTFINAVSRVQVDIDSCLEAPKEFIASSVHQDGSDGRMMTDLFGIEGAATDVGLKGFPEYGIERFHDVKEE